MHITHETGAMDRGHRALRLGARHVVPCRRQREDGGSTARILWRWPGGKGSSSGESPMRAGTVPLHRFNNATHNFAGVEQQEDGEGQCP